MDWNKTMGETAGAKTESTGSNFRKDTVCEVVGYPRLTQGDVEGVIQVKELSSGKDLFVAIRGEKRKPALKNDKGEDADYPFVGYIIDDGMKQNLVPGDRVVVEAMDTYPDAGLSPEKPIRANYIRSLPTDESKVVQGIITLEGNTQKCFAVKVWEPQALTIEDLAQREDFNAAVEYYLQKQAAYNESGQRLPAKPTPGVQYRVINEQGELVGMSPMLVNHSLDQSLPQEERYKPMSTEDVVREFASFEAYAQDRIPGCRVEAVVFSNYAVMNSKYMAWQKPESKTTSPQVKMCMGKGRYFYNDEHLPKFGGGVMAAKEGILKLSAGKIDQRRGVRIGAENQIPSEVWVRGVQGHVHSMIADVNGAEIKIHPDMAVVMPQQRQAPAPEQAQQTAPGQPAAAPVEPEGYYDGQPPVEAYEQEVDTLLDEMGTEQPAQRHRGPGM